MPSHCLHPFLDHKKIDFYSWYYISFLSSTLYSMLFRWCPRVMIHQERVVWICAINSSCTEYIIISKHLWIVIASWLRFSLSIKPSFISLICRTTIFHSDCLAWIFISVLFFPPCIHHCSLFISLKKKKKKSRAAVTHMAETTSVTGTLHSLLSSILLDQHCPLVVFFYKLLVKGKSMVVYSASNPNPLTLFPSSVESFRAAMCF